MRLKLYAYKNIYVKAYNKEDAYRKLIKMGYWMKKSERNYKIKKVLNLSDCK